MRATNSIGTSLSVPWLTCWIVLAASAVHGELPAARARLRKPVALLLLEREQQLLVANRAAGSISQVPLEGGDIAEFDLAETLSDLIALPDGGFLLATDESQHRLLLLRRETPVQSQISRAEQPAAIRVHAELPIAPYPVQVVASPNGRRAYVTSLWSRTITAVRVNADPHAATAQSVLEVLWQTRLPFAPRELLLVPGRERLIVADSFGGQLGIVEPESGKLVAQRELPAHNIRGLALSPDGRKLIVVHQIASTLAETTHNDIHWGILMSNVSRWLLLDNVLAPDAPLLAESHVIPLGGPGRAGGDPAQLAVAPDGHVLMTIAGVNQVAYGSEHDFSLERLDVGRRPTAVAISSDSQRGYVANTFGDSISVLDLTLPRVQRTIALGPRPKLSLAERGEELFYDATLSHDGWFSCHSCHTDGHSNGMLNDNLGDGSFGAAKRVLSLLGTADTGPWGWNGQAASLDGQIRKSIRTTMLGNAPSASRLEALTAYVESLEPPPSLGRLQQLGNKQSARRGRGVFESRGCTGCHGPETYTSDQTYDVGLTDRRGNRLFNPPSLRGVSQRDGLFHDNSAASLEELLTTHRHQLDQPLSPTELADLLAFLRRL